ncbi:Leucine-rich repeat containing-like protein isoform 1 [Theobroma cacao]|uniref:Leucine-rich repeat containing-like protein isoform 1 n=1 Tax=Theobroma cacao TaxID=3641 RepID=A0A061EJA1_THECC|nr:Leucine-rich repeat containing-like protein isoform 1 [Theobroma cacao]EOY04684.1 Leucine-rich repeat containing-like protein isoform 1 [Theobroma cacao]
MADTIASPLLQSLLDRLDSFCLSFGDGDEMLTRLRSVVASVKEVAAVAEQRFEMAAETKRWLTEVKRLACELDYLLDDYEQQVRKVRNQKLISSCFCFLTRIENRRPIEHVLQKLTTLASQGDWPLETNWRPDLYFRLYSGTSFVGSEPEVVGRDLDRDKVISLLFRKTQACKVVSIVGVGGLGKTALARLIYNDEKVTHTFRYRYWVSLGNDLNVNIERIGVAICSRKILSMNALEDGVTRELVGKIFLVVLDNLCHEEMDLAITLRRWFSVGSPGSAVIVTTRSTAAADSVGDMPVYYLQPLRDADCLDMFWKVALLPREEMEENQNTKLSEIGKAVVANCRGLPLAVKILGALLPYNGEMDDWLSVASLALLELQKYSYTSNILPVLCLSYDLLPSKLKQCFAYCSIFPREFWISKENLMQLWIAEGFLQTSGSSESLDDIAEDCFMKLLQCSFFEDIIRDDSGNILCRMHDLVYDFALTVSSTTCSVMRIASFEHFSAELRHCSLICESEPSPALRYLSKLGDLQTLLLLSGNFDSISDAIFSRFSHLRVLDFCQTGICELPVSIGALKHMRYLDLSRTYIRKIPESIGNLKYLQILKLTDCYNLEELPKTLPQLTNLINLGIWSCCSLTYFPSGIGKLRLLKKLPTFVLGKRSDCAKLNDLSGLDLTERLEIKNLENVTKEADAQDAKLYEKVSLHSLGLSWGDNDCMNAQMSAKILENLSPPQNLRDLCLKGYRGSSFPSWMNQSLLNLLKISLINCSCQELPPLGQLPSLKVLYLKGMSEVRTIGHEFYGNGAVRGFPCLEQLEIYDMHNLEGWKSIQMEKTEIFTVVGGSSGPLSQEAFPCLDKLVVKGCRRLTALPVIPNLRSLALCDSNGMLLCSVVHLPSLSSLVIEKLKELESLTDYSKSFCSIEKLTLYDCDHLDYLFERNQVFSALKYLSILYCDGLMSLPLGLRLLTSLQRFDVIECGHLNDISILQTLSSLRELIIEGCPMLLSLPSGIHNLTNLRRLVIKGCPALQKDTWI